MSYVWPNYGFRVVYVGPTPPTPPTPSGTLFKDLGLLGGNGAWTNDYSTSRYYQNAFLDSRGFGPAGSYAGGNTGVSLDSNGWPTVPTRVVITTASGPGTDGNLPAGTYHCSFQSTSHTTTMTLEGQVNATMVNVVQVADGLTTTFDLVLSGAPGLNEVHFDFSGPVQNVIIARTGSPAGITNKFNPDFINHVSKFASIRMMDFMNVNNNDITTWAERQPFTESYPHAFEDAVDMCNALYTSSGSLIKSAWINIPGLVDNNFGTQAATILNSRGNNGLRWIVEVGNEPWNSQFDQFHLNLANALTEVQTVANYGDIATVTSAVRTGGVTTVTVPGTMPSFITSGSHAMVWCDDSSFAASDINSPVIITKLSSNTFSYPNAGANGNIGSSNFAVIFNLTSTLLTDNVTSSLWDLADKYYTRRVHEIATVWHAIRPQDKFVLNLQMYGTGSYSGYGAYPSAHWEYAKYLGSGNISWLWGCAIAPYFSSDAETTVNGAINALQSSLDNSIKYAITAHVYRCLKYGVVPVSYEGGPDCQQAATVNIALNTDSRMGTLVTELLNLWYQTGADLFHFYKIIPDGFSNDQQGTWSSSQTYTDDTSPKHAALLAYQESALPVTYHNQFGNPGTVLASDYAIMTDNGQVDSAGLMGFYGPTDTSALEYLIVAGTTRTYTFTLWGSDNVSNTSIKTLIDSTQVGSSILHNGGAWNSGSNTAAASASFTAALTAGPHILRLQLTAGLFSSPGIQKMVIS